MSPKRRLSDSGAKKPRGASSTGAHLPRNLVWALLIFIVYFLWRFVYLTNEPTTFVVGGPRLHERFSNEGCAEAIEKQQQVLLQAFRAELRSHKSIALIGYPGHENKGDSAIWVGEKVLLAQIGVETVYQASWSTFNKTALDQTLAKHPNLLILLHGGGNFGDLYPWEMDGRLEIVRDYAHVPIRFAPQSVHFGEERRMHEVRDKLAAHPDLKVFVRDLPSLALVEEHFAPAGIQIGYVPDAAFMIGRRPDLVNTALATHDILLFHRVDTEATTWFDEDTYTDYDTLIADWGMKEYALWYPRYSHFDSQAVDRFEAGARFLQAGKIVVLNRLHGHIMAMLLGIPHIIVDNRIGKLSAYYNSWTKECKLGMLASSPKEALRLAEQYVESIKS